MPSKPHHDLNQALQELASKNIQADPSHLVESIRRQFANPLEYVRELIANGLDAGATGIRVRGRWLEGEKYPLQIFFEDDGKGMGRAEVERYLTVFDSFKDGDGATVGRHGVGKLSPWADSHLGTYTVDTCDSKERTFLHMESVHQGVMRVYPAGDRPPGTTVTLAWRGRDAEELAFRMERVTNELRVAAVRIVVSAPPTGGHVQQQLWMGAVSFRISPISVKHACPTSLVVVWALKKLSSASSFLG